MKVLGGLRQRDLLERHLYPGLPVLLVVGRLALLHRVDLEVGGCGEGLELREYVPPLLVAPDLFLDRLELAVHLAIVALQTDHRLKLLLGAVDSLAAAIEYAQQRVDDSKREQKDERRCAHDAEQHAFAQGQVVPGGQ